MKTVKLNLNQITSYSEAFSALKAEKLPFKLSLILCKDYDILMKEYAFYETRRNELMEKYFVKNQDTQQYEQKAANTFTIYAGMEEECNKDFKELFAFESTVDIYQIEESWLEKLDIAPEHVTALMPFIETKEDTLNE